MKFLRKWLRNRRLERAIAPRRQEILTALRAEIDPRLELKFRPSRGGFDVTLQASVAGQPLGILRMNPAIPKVKPVPGNSLKQPLSPAARIDLEWQTYQRLSALGLSPRPLWRSHDALLCSQIDWPKASIALRSLGADFWPAMQRIVAAVQEMHRAGVTHLDLNTGNIFLQPKQHGVQFIDFEYGPAGWATNRQCQAFDWLRLILCCARRRRGQAFLRSDPTRFSRLFEPAWPLLQEVCDLEFLLRNLPDIWKSGVTQVFSGFSGRHALSTRRAA
ncbi:lipopolysaccharide kinase InaA family protein [Planctomicrobium sp. SH664]|uniref:lipopolysaccharide kinase InaA family protein n=1 Tax=Planctomicrobium sp. SH664 TaxID=3448125 RepID=UPI003F5CADA8